MKKTILTTLIAAAVLMTGCSANTASSGTPGSQPAPTTEESAPASELEESSSQPAETPATVDTRDSSAPEASEEPAKPGETENPAETAGFVLAGPGGDVISADDIAKVEASDEEDYLANGLSASNWIQVETSGFTYLAEPGGEYRRVKVGEEICGLTLFDAGCAFIPDNLADSGSYIDQSYFSSGFAEFDGSVELSGTLSTASETSGLVEEGAVVFTPDDGSQLPVMNYQYDTSRGVYYPEDDMFPPVVVTGVEPQSDGEHVTLTLSGITMSSSVNNFSVVRAQAALAE